MTLHPYNGRNLSDTLRMKLSCQGGHVSGRVMRSSLASSQSPAAGRPLADRSALPRNRRTHRPGDGRVRLSADFYNRDEDIDRAGELLSAR
jgi:hypothetical protein